MSDARRYAMLARLVENGDWAVARVEILDKFGNVKLHYMGDKADMDKQLDAGFCNCAEQDYL